MHQTSCQILLKSPFPVMQNQTCQRCLYHTISHLLTGISFIVTDMRKKCKQILSIELTKNTDINCSNGRKTDTVICGAYIKSCVLPWHTRHRYYWFIEQFLMVFRDGSVLCGAVLLKNAFNVWISCIHWSPALSHLLRPNYTRFGIALRNASDLYCFTFNHHHRSFCW